MKGTVRMQHDAPIGAGAAHASLPPPDAERGSDRSTPGAPLRASDEIDRELSARAPAEPLLDAETERVWAVPFAAGAGRAAYERVFSAAWPLVKRLVNGYGASGQLYMAEDIERVLWSVAAHLAYTAVSDADQRALVEATGGPPEHFDPKVYWWWRPYNCPLCVLIECRRHRRPRPGTLHWTRHVFAHRLHAGMEDALQRRAAYDFRLGMPRSSDRLSLKYGSGARSLAPVLRDVPPT